MLIFCTLFDSRYLSRGIAMYESLCNHCQNFHLYVFAFNELCLNTLQSLNFDKMTVISLSDFEDDNLLRVKQRRSRNEYCWTCSSSTVLYVLDHYNADHCIYIDADLFFYNSPQILLDEMEDNESVLITPHNYTKKYDQGSKTGIYCVQFVYFKNDIQGRKVLNWWRSACLDWCYDRFENGRFGDQKYLDDWPIRFKGVHVLKHLGTVAPWNMQQYEIEQNGKQFIGTELVSQKKFEVVFYHYHSLAFVTKSFFSPRPYYERTDSSIHLLYNPYIKTIKKIRGKYHLEEMEVYFSYWKIFKYLAEVFLRRGFKEIHYIKLLHE